MIRILPLLIATIALGAVDAPPSPTPAAAAAHDGEIAWWTCSMHTSIHAAQAGACPICGMDLIPVTRAEIAEGVVRVDADRRQRIGLRFGVVKRGDLALHVRAFGAFAVDETRVAEVPARVAGWVESVAADRVGVAVTRGDALLTLTSPDWVAAQQELLATPAGDASPLRAAARRRLRQMGAPDDVVAQTLATKAAQDALPVRAPIDGVVLRKDAVVGAAVQPGQPLYRIAALDPLWLVVDVPEADLALVAAGQTARLRLPGRDDGPQARVERVLPEVRAADRAGQVRLTVANADGALRPGGSAAVDITVDAGERLIAPKEAVIVAGERRLVFVDLGDGALKPQAVHVGLVGDDAVEITAGLHDGDRVVTAGHFLLSAESRIRSAEAFWGTGDDKP